MSFHTPKPTGPGTNSDETPRRWGLLVGTAKVALAVAIIVFLVRRGDIDPLQLLVALRSHRVLTLAVVALLSLSYMGQACRWDVILRDRGIPAPYWQALRYLMIGKFFNLAVPGYFSEDIVRGLYLVRNNAAPRSKVLMSLMVDRLTGVLSLFVVCSLGLVVHYLSVGAKDAWLASLRTLVLLATAGAVAFVLVVRRFPRPPQSLRSVAGRLRLLRALESAYAELHYYCSTPGLQARVLGISLVNHSLVVACFVLFGYALGLEVSLADYFMFVPLGMLVTMVPIAPVGLGVGHLAFLSLFRMAGSPEGANLFSLFTAVCILVNLSGGLFYVGLGRGLGKAAEARTVAPSAVGGEQEGWQG